MKFKKSSRLPVIILTLALISLIIGVLLSPSILISLGPMKTTLLSQDPMVKATSHLEVTIFKFLFIAAGVALLGIGIGWKKIVGTKFISNISDLELPNNFVENAKSFSTKTSIIGYLAIVFAFLYLLLGEKLFNTETLIFINREDGVLENVTAIAFFICSLISLFIAIRFSKADMVVKILMVVYSIGFFFLAGEEISWGQRIFGFETNGFLAEANVQNETNLHNIFGYAADHFAILTIFIYGSILPFICRIFPFFQKLMYRLRIPMATMGLATVFLICSLIHNWTVLHFMHTLPGLRIAELREVLTGFLFVLLMIETLVLAKKHAVSPI